MRLERTGSQSNRRKALVADVPPPGAAIESALELEQRFIEVYRQVHGRMLDHAERTLDRESARDAAAEAAADVWCRWHLLRPEQRTDAYFITAVNHSIIDVLRGSRPSLELEDAEEELERKAALAMETISRGDTAADVLDLALAVMPTRRREVLLLVKEHAFTYPEAAEALGLSIGTINSHMRLAHRDLKTAFTRAGFRIADVQPNLLPKPTGGVTND